MHAHYTHKPTYPYIHTLMYTSHTNKHTIIYIHACTLHTQANLSDVGCPSVCVDFIG